jgi:hypothetical protein
MLSAIFPHPKFKTTYAFMPILRHSFSNMPHALLLPSPTKEDAILHHHFLNNFLMDAPFQDTLQGT